MECVDGASAEDLVVATQHTVVWRDEKVLELAPGQNAMPLSFVYDLLAEQLSFPAIYYGVAREFREGVKVTAFQVVSSVLRIRGCQPEHLLYMAMKILRLRVSQGLYAIFCCKIDIGGMTRETIQHRRFFENGY